VTSAESMAITQWPTSSASGVDHESIAAGR
jgi:hypothetical protein